MRRTVFTVIALSALVALGSGACSSARNRETLQTDAQTVKRDPGTVKLVTPQAGMRVELRLTGIRNVITVTGEGTRVPAGSYEIQSLTLVMRDASGNSWQVQAAGLPPSLEKLTVTEDQVTELAIGPPLTLQATAQPTGAGQERAVAIGLSIRGQTGEYYSPAVTQEGSTVAAPSFQIVDQKGNVLCHASFAYG